MKIQIMSDLHLEFHRDGGKSFLESLPPAAEVLVLAGDIAPVALPNVLPWALGVFCGRWKHVVFVPGNHEYYGSDARQAHLALQSLRHLRSRGLVVLDRNSTLEIEGHRFIGDTMWFRRAEDPDAVSDKAFMSDFAAIKGFEPWVYEQAAETQEHFEAAINRPTDIVVTHHLPSMASVPNRFKHSASNAFFVCDQERLIVQRKPALWIHGHTHTACDYMLGETRVVANPLGYPGEASQFSPSLVVEV